MKITACLAVEKIEESLPFWVDRMGFRKALEAPDGEGLGFVILARDNAELMLQTIESIRKDVPQLAPMSVSGDVNLYIEAEEFEDILRRLRGYPIAMPERTAVYGMREISVREPSGHIVTFAVRSS